MGMGGKRVAEIEIRRIEKGEVDGALELVMSVFMAFEAPDYSEEGVEAFKRTAVYNPAFIESLLFYGAFSENGLVGVIATRNEGSHIALFFVDARYHRKGIGRKLFEAALNDCPSEEMTVNSSPYAVEAYHRLGFMDTAEEQIRDGIRYTPMVYKKV